MSRLIKDYVTVGDHLSLDELIAQLTTLRDRLPEGADANVRMRGDDVFGRHLSIAFMRPMTAAEVECEDRYGDCGLEFRSAA